MQRIQWILLILLLALAACSPQAAVQEERPSFQAAAVANPTSVPAPTTTPTPTAYPTPMPKQPVPQSCPITQPPKPRFVPPEPHPEWGPNGDFWYGSDDLWTLLRPDGTWRRLPHSEEGYVQKTVWWREGYNWQEEQQPALTITARKLDGEASLVEVDHATNGFHPDFGSFMLSGIALPELGCWEITGEYEGHQLSFVVWVAP